MVEGEERQQRQIAPAVIVPVEEGELLRAVRRVIRRIEIDGDVPGPPVAAALMALDHARGQFASHPIQFLHADLILEARDRGLGRERVASDGVAPEQEFVNRVVGEPIGVVRIGMAAGEAEDALRQQLLERVPHLPRLPIIHETAREAIDQSVARVRGFQQDRAAV